MSRNLSPTGRVKENMKTFLGVFAAVAVALGGVACGEPSGSPAPPAGGGSEPSSPDSPISIRPEPGSDVHDVGGRPERVRPRPGMSDLRPVAGEKARLTPDGRHLRVVYWSGVEPCNVLDHVDVGYATESVTVTLYEGSDPEQPDVACIEIALQKVVKVSLEEPLGGRKILDGAD